MCTRTHTHLSNPTQTKSPKAPLVVSVSCWWRPVEQMGNRPGEGLQGYSCPHGGGVSWAGLPTFTNLSGCPVPGRTNHEALGESCHCPVEGLASTRVVSKHSVPRGSECISILGLLSCSLPWSWTTSGSLAGWEPWDQDGV